MSKWEEGQWRKYGAVMDYVRLLACLRMAPDHAQREEGPTAGDAPSGRARPGVQFGYGPQFSGDPHGCKSSHKEGAAWRGPKWKQP